MISVLAPDHCSRKGSADKGTCPYAKLFCNYDHQNREQQLELAMRDRYIYSVNNCYHCYLIYDKTLDMQLVFFSCKN